MKVFMCKVQHRFEDLGPVLVTLQAATRFIAGCKVEASFGTAITITWL